MPKKCRKNAEKMPKNAEKIKILILKNLFFRINWYTYILLFSIIYYYYYYLIYLEREFINIIYYIYTLIKRRVYKFI